MHNAPEPGLVEHRRLQRMEWASRVLRGESFVQSTTKPAPRAAPAARAPRFQDAPLDDLAVRRAAQELFLHGVHAVAPEVIEDLATDAAGRPSAPLLPGASPEEADDSSGRSERNTRIRFSLSASPHADRADCRAAI